MLEMLVLRMLVSRLKGLLHKVVLMFYPQETKSATTLSLAEESHLLLSDATVRFTPKKMTQTMMSQYENDRDAVKIRPGPTEITPNLRQQRKSPIQTSRVQSLEWLMGMERKAQAKKRPSYHPTTKAAKAAKAGGSR